MSVVAASAAAAVSLFAGGVKSGFICGAGCRLHVVEPPDRPARRVRGWQSPGGGGGALGGAVVSQPQEDQPSGGCDQPETGEAVEQDPRHCLAGAQPGGYQGPGEGSFGSPPPPRCDGEGLR